MSVLSVCPSIYICVSHVMLLNSKVCERKVKIVHKLLWYHSTGDFCELCASVSTFNINYTAINIQICYRKLKKSKQMMKTFAELTYMDMLHRSKSSTSKTRRLRDDLLETFKISQGVKIIRIFSLQFTSRHTKIPGRYPLFDCASILKCWSLSSHADKANRNGVAKK